MKNRSMMKRSMKQRTDWCPPVRRSVCRSAYCYLFCCCSRRPSPASWSQRVDRSKLIDHVTTYVFVLFFLLTLMAAAVVKRKVVAVVPVMVAVVVVVAVMACGGGGGGEGGSRGGGRGRVCTAVVSGNYVESARAPRPRFPRSIVVAEGRQEVFPPVGDAGVVCGELRSCSGAPQSSGLCARRASDVLLRSNIDPSHLTVTPWKQHCNAYCCRVLLLI